MRLRSTFRTHSTAAARPTAAAAGPRTIIFANTLRWQASRKLKLTMAGEMNYHKSHNDSRNNYLGTYQFAGLHDYCYAENFPGTNCEDDPRRIV